MKKQVSFRFDIDSHKCINEGVARLLELAEKTNSKFTFFLNTGKAISVIETISSMIKKIKRKDSLNELPKEIHQLSAMQKLGIKDYIYAAIINPSLGIYQNKIKEIISTGNEIGLHGGKNHDKWHRYAKDWDKNKINQEIEYGLDNLNFIDPSYKAVGFASPGWTTSDLICQSAQEKGFKYLADININEPFQKIELKNGLRQIPTNILGNNGVAYFESCTAKGFSMNEKINDFFEKIKTRQDLAVMYDHPYWAGLHEIKTLEYIIKRLQDEDYTITEMRNL